MHGLYVNEDGQIIIIYPKKQLPFDNFSKVKNAHLVEIDTNVFKAGTNKDVKKYIKRHKYTWLDDIPSKVKAPNLLMSW